MSLRALTTLVAVALLSSCVQTVTNTQGLTNDGYAVHAVYFATTRNDSLKPNLNTRFGKQRAEPTFGINSIAIPADYPRAHKASFVHWNISLKRNPNKHLALIDINTLESTNYFERLKRAAANTPNEPILVFIHGYNTPFERAARITAKLNYDLGLQSPSVLFSWPSQERPSAYSADEENLAWSQPAINEFIESLLTELPDEEFILLGHSMGSRALINTLQALPIEVTERISHAVLAAPDVDADIFQRDLAPKLSALNIPMALYVSDSDFALKASNQLYGYDRAGYAGDNIVVVDGIDTIDASEADAELLGHEYFSQGAETVEDLYQWIVLGRPPSERSTLEPVMSENGRYWRIINPQE